PVLVNGVGGGRSALLSAASRRREGVSPMRSSPALAWRRRPLPAPPSDDPSVLLLLLILAAAAAGVLVVQVGPPPFPERWPTWTELRAVLLLEPGRVPPAPSAADLPGLALWGAWLLVTTILAVRLP